MLTPEFQEWRDGLEHSDKEVINCLIVTKIVRDFVMQLFDFLDEQDMCEVVRMPNVNGKSPAQQIAAVIANCVRMSRESALTEILWDWQRNNPDFTKTIVAALSYEVLTRLKEWDIIH